MSDWNAKTIEEFRASEGGVAGSSKATACPRASPRPEERAGSTSAGDVPAHDTDRNVIYVFATRGETPTNPDWYYNLTAAGEGSVERGTETYNVTVRDVIGDERDLIYAEQARRYPGFAEYERQTDGLRTMLELRRA